MGIIINPEYERIVPKLSEQEFQSLKESIRNSGQHVPLTINQNGILLDGHHRYRACQELGLKPELQEKCFGDPLLEQLFVIDVNLKRRHLTEAQKIEMGYALKSIYQKIAERNESLAGKLYGKGKKQKQKEQEQSNNNDSPVSYETPLSSTSSSLLLPMGRVDKVIAKDVGVSSTSFFRGETLIKESPEEWEKVKAGKLTVNEGYNAYKKQKRQEELLREAAEIDPALNLTEVFKLINGDFIEYGKDIPDSSIDMIFTDPPYDKESLYQYNASARFSARVLKPGGIFMVYVGGYALPDTIRAIEDPANFPDKEKGYYLKFNWKIAVLHSGPTQEMHGKKVFVAHKDILYYYKGEKLNPDTQYIADFVKSSPPDKALHKWAQSPVEAEHCMHALPPFNKEQQIVLDIFMGSGTTGIAALNLGRKFIGIEKDLERYEIAKARLEIAKVKKKIAAEEEQYK